MVKFKKKLQKSQIFSGKSILNRNHEVIKFWNCQISSRKISQVAKSPNQSSSFRHSRVNNPTPIPTFPGTKVVVVAARARFSPVLPISRAWQTTLPDGVSFNTQKAEGITPPAGWRSGVFPGFFITPGRRRELSHGEKVLICPNYRLRRRRRSAQKGHKIYDVIINFALSSCRVFFWWEIFRWGRRCHLNFARTPPPRNFWRKLAWTVESNFTTPEVLGLSAFNGRLFQPFILSRFGRAEPILWNWLERGEGELQIRC